MYFITKAIPQKGKEPSPYLLLYLSPKELKEILHTSKTLPQSLPASLANAEVHLPLKRPGTAFLLPSSPNHEEVADLQDTLGTNLAKIPEPTKVALLKEGKALQKSEMWVVHNTDSHFRFLAKTPSKTWTSPWFSPLLQF
jgi:hypothetical protein